MLWIGRNKVERIYIGNNAVAALYRGGVKIWEAISSCFGSGIWRPQKIWKGTDKWKSN